VPHPTLFLFRRPPYLLFAPALLLDLAALLLVSAIMLGSLPHKRQTVMQITLPLKRQKAQRDKFVVRFELPSPAELRQLRQWQTVVLTGDQQADSLNLERFRRKVEHMLQFPDNIRGVALRFGSQVRYGRIVDALDCVNQLDVKKYMLDIQSSAPALYVLTNAHQQPRPLTTSADYSPAPAPDSATSATSRWVHQVGAPLHHPAWGTALLACLGLAVVGAAVYLIQKLS
jgi:biopolymer transport protein ExbD